uniref:Secreted protein n=1 Tax=Rhipicephalus appendiculatus TaxID=34631 RepID=A0A131Y924_RHIAP
MMTNSTKLSTVVLVTVLMFLLPAVEKRARNSVLVGFPSVESVVRPPLRRQYAIPFDNTVRKGPYGNPPGHRRGGNVMPHSQVSRRRPGSSPIRSPSGGPAGKLFRV